MPTFQVFRRTASLATCALALTLFALTACGGSKEPKEPSAAGLPNYDIEQAALFDDSFAPQIFTVRQDPAPAVQNPRFEPRVAFADVILVAKVITVSRDGSMSGASAYSVTLRPERLLVGRADLGEIVATVTKTSPVFFFLENAGSSWLGKTVILLVRRYGEQGKVTEHFRAEPDSEAVRASIARIRGASGPK